MSSFTLHETMFFKENSLPVKVLLRDPEIPFSLHGHDFYEIVVVVSGKGFHLLQQDKRQLQEGMVFCIRPGTIHGYADIENLVLYNLLIGKKAFSVLYPEVKDVAGFPETFMQEEGDVPLVRLNSHQHAEIVALVSAVKEESEQQDYSKGSTSMTYSKLLQFLILVSRFHSARRGSAFQNDQRLEKVIIYMEQNIDRSIPLNELVEVSNMSASTLNRQFKLSTGWSPVDFHIHRRIAYASNLLLTTDLSIERISEKTGFSDANYFARQFRSHMQMSPRQYKQLWTTPKED
ncbi:helix-turn-helix domain-containing protein [uncultured Sphaerochaeta sp.]|uniref:helix-turn-helix domain-containing protein n=1 Tax=uncultured Sphaerochaeta sp. TaxID=886478 RepID=UPI002A0A1D92|nr:helix-turn-helix domain-containing protein [uncultured Sphaerochaeta sp.]